jgi:hypothetical protein
MVLTRWLCDRQQSQNSCDGELGPVLLQHLQTFTILPSAIVETV